MDDSHGRLTDYLFNYKHVHSALSPWICEWIPWYMTKLLAHWSDGLPATEATGTLDYFRATEGGW